MIILLLAPILSFLLVFSAEPISSQIKADESEKTQSNNNEVKIPTPSKKKLHLIIDGLIFDIQQKPRGVSQVWLNLIPEFAKFSKQGHKISVIQRNRPLAPLFEKIQYDFDLKILPLGKNNLESLVRKVAEKDGAKYAPVFTSSYYTHAPGFCNLLLVYDTIPENFGMAHGPNTEYYPRIVGLKSWANTVASIARSTTNDIIRLYNVPKEIIVTSATRIDQNYKSASKEQVENFKRKYQIDPNVPYFLVVGKRWSFKNVISFWKAIARLTPEQKSNLQIVLIGEAEAENVILGTGPLQAEEKQYAEGFHRIISIGNVPQEEMAACYTGAHVNVYIALYEGFGMPVPEGMACGVPAIISKTWDISDKGAWKVEPTNIEQIHKAIVESISNPKLLESKKKNALIEAGKFGTDPAHGWNEMASDIFNHVLNGPKRGGECKF